MSYTEMAKSVKEKLDQKKAEYRAKEERIEEAFDELFEYSKDFHEDGRENMKSWAAYVLSEGRGSYKDFLDELEGAEKIIDDYKGDNIPIKESKDYGLSLNDRTLKLMKFCGKNECKSGCIASELFKYLLDERGDGRKKEKHARLKEFFNRIASCSIPTLPEPQPDSDTIEENAYASSGKKDFVMKLARGHYFDSLKKELKTAKDLINNKHAKQCAAIELNRNGVGPFFFVSLVFKMHENMKYLEEPGRFLGAIGGIDRFFRDYVENYKPGSGRLVEHKCDDGKTIICLKTHNSEITKRSDLLFPIDVVDSLTDIVIGSSMNLRRHFKVANLFGSMTESANYKKALDTSLDYMLEMMEAKGAEDELKLNPLTYYQKINKCVENIDEEMRKLKHIGEI